MGQENRFTCFCPSCGKEKLSRKRDIGKLCSSCNMKKIELENRHLKFKEVKKTAQQSQKDYHEKNKLSRLRKAQIMIQQAKIRAVRGNYPFDLTVEDVLSLWPEDNKCPVFGYSLKLDSTKADKNFAPSLDKIIPWLGYTKENTRVISWEANRKKSDSSISDLKAILAYMEANKEDS